MAGSLRAGRSVVGVRASGNIQRIAICEQGLGSFGMRLWPTEMARWMFSKTGSRLSTFHCATRLRSSGGRACGRLAPHPPCSAATRSCGSLPLLNVRFRTHVGGHAVRLADPFSVSREARRISLRLSAPPAHALMLCARQCRSRRQLPRHLMSCPAKSCRRAIATA